MTLDSNARKMRNYTLSQYAFAYIDILGQKEALASITSIPSAGSPALKDFEALIQNTIGVVETARRAFHDFKGGIDESIDSRPIKSDEHTGQASQVMNSELKLHAFSDTVLLYCSLLEGDERFPMVGIVKMLGAVASTQLTAMSDGIFLRGGIEIGLGTELGGGDFYGPALLKAYLLERDSAIYPRVIVGEQLVGYIDKAAIIQGHDNRSRIQRVAAQFAQSLISVDQDSRSFVDYLGVNYRKYSARSLPPSVYGEARTATVKALEGFRRAKNSKLAHRYLALLGYIDRSAPNWLPAEP